MDLLAGAEALSSRIYWRPAAGDTVRDVLRRTIVALVALRPVQYSITSSPVGTGLRRHSRRATEGTSDGPHGAADLPRGGSAPHGSRVAALTRLLRPDVEVGVQTPPA
jgi:hypothetical protein